MSAVEKLTSADRQVAASVDQWDGDPWLLNTPTGTVDLRTGELRPSTREEFHSKCTAAPPAPFADCPLWLAFLDRVMGGNDDLIAFLKRVFGYCLTGRTTEQALFFCYGVGANGKGVMMNTMRRILGDYATSTPMETLTISPGGGDRHPTEVADLKGARLVITTETGEGRWNEGRIKQMTGGDPIKARYMHKDFFEFEPNFKLWISGNQEPRLRNVDIAIRRRLHIIPFTQRIPDAEQDKEFADKLRGEWDAILRWAIEGCVDWQERGALDPPAMVIGATGEYFEHEDSVGSWLADACEQDAEAWAASADLFASWKAYAEQAGEYAGSQRRLTEVLRQRGFVSHREAMGRRGSLGLRLKSSL